MRHTIFRCFFFFSHSVENLLYVFRFFCIFLVRSRVDRVAYKFFFFFGEVLYREKKDKKKSHIEIQDFSQYYIVKSFVCQQKHLLFGKYIN